MVQVYISGGVGCTSGDLTSATLLGNADVQVESLKVPLDSLRLPTNVPCGAAKLILVLRGRGGDMTLDYDKIEVPITVTCSQVSTDARLEVQGRMNKSEVTVGEANPLDGLTLRVYPAGCKQDSYLAICQMCQISIVDWELLQTTQVRRRPSGLFQVCNLRIKKHRSLVTSCFFYTGCPFLGTTSAVLIRGQGRLETAGTTQDLPDDAFQANGAEEGGGQQ